MTRAGEGEIASQGVAKVKRSMKKCEACRARKIACNPRDREWSGAVQEKCNSCDNLGLPCGPNVRLNAKVESRPRKLASKNALEAAGASAGLGVLPGKGTVESNIYRRDGKNLQQTAPSNPEVQVPLQAQTRALAAIDQPPIREHQTSDVEMALDTNGSPRNLILGAANTSQTTYDPMEVSKFGFVGAAAMGQRPSTISDPTQYPASVRSRSTRPDDFASHLKGPVPTELRSRTDFVSLGSAHFPVDAENALLHPKNLNLDPGFNDLEHLHRSDLQSAKIDHSFACASILLHSERNFRLLELLPGQGSAPLVTRLIEADTQSSYEALSYVWDDTSADSAIINIYTGPIATEAAITLNLANALRVLRYPGKSRNIWIDALCINNTDTTEKSSQTKIMGDILSYANNLCIWLGPASRDSDLAFKLVALCTDLAKFDALSRNLAFIQYWDALTDLMKRPWFRRRWSIMEVCFARDAVVYCGSLSAGWKEFKQAVSFVITKHHNLRRTIRSAKERRLDSLHDVSQLDANRLIQLADMTVRKSAGGDVLQYLQSLDTLIFNCAWLDCGDPRDTLYALLSLSGRASRPQRGKGPLPAVAYESSARNPNQEVNSMDSATESNAARRQPGIEHTSKLSVFDAIKIDYAKSVFEVCRDFSLCTIDHSRSLDFICRPWAPQGQGLPSWMPTVSSNSYVLGKDGCYKRAAADPLFGKSNLNGLTAYNAALETEPVYRYDAATNPRELRLLGFVCGEVVAKRPPATAGIIPWAWLDDKDFLSSARDAKESFCRTIVADRGPASPYPPPAIFSLAWDYIAEQRATGSNLDTTEFRAVEEQESIVDEFLARVQATVWGRRLLLVRVGDVQLLALGPEYVKKRDLICILHGCSVPVVLRKLDPREYPSNGVQYRLIGECYVDGIMNGEAFDMKDKEMEMEYFALV